MKIETILKTILVLTIASILLAMPVNVFAETSNAADLEDFWEDQGSIEDLEGETPTDTETPVETPTETPTETPITPAPETNTNTDTNTNTNTNTSYNDAGLAEDTMMVVGVTVLVITAIYAFKKVNDYKNI